MTNIEKDSRPFWQYADAHMEMWREFILIPEVHVGMKQIYLLDLGVYHSPCYLPLNCQDKRLIHSHRSWISGSEASSAFSCATSKLHRTTLSLGQNHRNLTITGIQLNGPTYAMKRLAFLNACSESSKSQGKVKEHSCACASYGSTASVPPSGNLSGDRSHFC